MTKAAYVLRIAPSGIDRVAEALASDQVIIGWAEAEGLLDEALPWERFREIIRGKYYKDETNLRRAGAAGGHMWKFIRDMKPGDLIVVPHWSQFYVAEVVGLPQYDKSKVAEDTAYRRAVRWLNGKQPIARQLARSALLARMKTQGTSADASDLVDEIEECLSLARQGATPTFELDLQARLIREVLAELRSGRIESFGFERLIRSLLLRLGADEAQVVPRSSDKGADIVATFRVAGTFLQKVAVQAKHWQPDPPVGQHVVEQLIRGIEAENATLGMVITTGSISEEASEAAERYFTDRGVRIELVDGEQFAKLIVEHGLAVSSRSTHPRSSE
jgi:restriction endonuclease Mrr